LLHADKLLAALLIYRWARRYARLRRSLSLRFRKL